MIRLKRVYDKPEPGDGKRFLVERLWPRGVKKADLDMDGWRKDAAPSDGLRKWFAHDPEKWAAFQRRYFTELNARADFLEPILDAARQGPVTLLYSSHDVEHNNAVALRAFLAARLPKKKSRAQQARQ